MAVKFATGRVDYEGCVLHIVEENRDDHSDFYAIVWDERMRRVLKEWFGTTLCSTMGVANVDATPETIAKAKNYIRRFVYNRLKAEIEDRLSEVRPGRMVKVVRGRKVPIGTVSVVKRVVNTRYGQCVVIDVEGVDVLISSDNVQVLYEVDEEALNERVERELKENIDKYYGLVD